MYGVGNGDEYRKLETLGSIGIGAIITRLIERK